MKEKIKDYGKIRKIKELVLTLQEYIHAMMKDPTVDELPLSTIRWQFETIHWGRISILPKYFSLRAFKDLCEKSNVSDLLDFIYDIELDDYDDVSIVFDFYK